MLQGCTLKTKAKNTLLLLLLLLLSIMWLLPTQTGHAAANHRHGDLGDNLHASHAHSDQPMRRAQTMSASGNFDAFFSALRAPIMLIPGLFYAKFYVEFNKIIETSMHRIFDMWIFCVIISA